MLGARLEDVLHGAIAFGLPLARPFRGITVREGMLIEGPSGWGEFAPFDDYSDQAAGLWLHSAVEAAYGTWPTPGCASITVNAIIPEVVPDEVHALARAAVVDQGCTTIKVKVGESLADDELRVGAIREILDELLGRGVGAIRIDANGRWSARQAVTALKHLSSFGLEYVEQPCMDPADIRSIRAQISVPIAVDEGIRGALDPSGVDLQGIGDIAIIKAAPLGGVEMSLRVIANLGMPVVISGSLDSSVGLGVATALASTLHLERASGLGTGALLADDLSLNPVQPVAGRVEVRRTWPDPAALDRAAGRLSESRKLWWRARLIAAWEAKGERLGG